MKDGVEMIKEIILRHLYLHGDIQFETDDPKNKLYDVVIIEIKKNYVEMILKKYILIMPIMN